VIAIRASWGRGTARPRDRVPAEEARTARRRTCAGSGPGSSRAGMRTPPGPSCRHH